MVQVNIYIVLLFFTVVCVVALIFSYFGAKIVKGLSPKTMYNVATCMVFASNLSGCISLWAVWIALPNAHNVYYTHQYVIVDILGILVTILMGWNIISVVDIKRKADQVEHISKDFEHVVVGIMRLNMKGFIMRDDYDALIDSCFSSLEEIMNCENRDISKSTIKEIMNLLHQIQILYRNGKDVKIFPNKKQKYLYILNNIDSEYCNDIHKMIENIQVSSSVGQEYATANNVNAH